MLLFQQEQYVFVYDCLLEALICGDTTVSSTAFPEIYTDLCLFDSDINKTKLEEQFEVHVYSTATLYVKPCFIIIDCHLDWTMVSY